MHTMSGDVILWAPKEGKATFKQRGIQHYGSVVTHMETLVIEHALTPGDPDVLMGGCAHHPHFEILPVLPRLVDADAAIYRWHGFTGDSTWSVRHQMYAREMTDMNRLLAELEQPYDDVAIGSILWNESVRFMFGKELSILHHEHQVYCVEAGDLMSRIAGVDLFAELRPQKYLAPVHAERQVLAGRWVLVKDFGLHERILSGRR